MLVTLGRRPMKVFVTHNDVTPKQRLLRGNEREAFKNWIGTATPDNARGAWCLMQALYEQLGPGAPQIISITGDSGTPVSLERAQGVQDFIDQSRRGRMVQLTYGDGSDALGDTQARALMNRYPQANIIWAANDSMALGAQRAVQGRKSGHEVVVGGMGGCPRFAAKHREQGHGSHRDRGTA